MLLKKKKMPGLRTWRISSRRYAQLHTGQAPSSLAPIF